MGKRCKSTRTRCVRPARACRTRGPACVRTQIGQYLRLHPWNSPATTITTKLSYINEEQMAGVNRTLVEYVSLLHTHRT